MSTHHRGGAHDDHGHDHEPTSSWSRALHAIRPHAHNTTAAIQTAEEASQAGIRAAWISLAGMGATAALQIVIVAVSGSIALLADTLHNLGHLVTTIPLLLAFRIGQRRPTKTYPYGYRRAEDLAGLLIALVIAISAALIIWESIRAIVEPRPLTNLGWVFATGIVGAVGNELVAIYRIRIGRKIGSAALVAEGNHARADGLTSIAVILGAIGAWAGFPRVDAIAGLLIAAVIVGILVQSSRSVVHRLMDGVDHDLIDTITAVAAAAPGIEHVEDVRARWSGHRMQAQLTLGVDPNLSVAEGHDLAERAHHELVHAIPHLDSVTVHIHPSHTPPRLHEHTDTPAATR